jgi:hypothetical protein
MQQEDRGTGLELVDVADERVRTLLERVESMSDDRVRELVKHEDPSVVEAAEAMIARRHAGQRQTI